MGLLNPEFVQNQGTLLLNEFRIEKSHDWISVIDV